MLIFSYVYKLVRYYIKRRIPWFYLKNIIFCVTAFLQSISLSILFCEQLYEDACESAETNIK